MTDIIEQLRGLLFQLQAEINRTDGDSARGALSSAMDGLDSAIDEIEAARVAAAFA